jgi:hypothetical protein
MSGQWAVEVLLEEDLTILLELIAVVEQSFVDG